MSAEQNGRPTEQEWAEAQAEGGLAALRPLIDREREAARAEGMAAVAGPVLALIDDLTDEIEELRADLPPQGPSRVAHAYRTAGLSEARDRLREAIPTDATEALAQFKAQWQAEALRWAVTAAPPREFGGPAVAWLRARADRIASPPGGVS